MLGFLGILFAGLQVISVAAKLDAVTWSDARISGAALVLVVVASILAGAFGWYAGRALSGEPAQPEPVRTEAPARDLAPGRDAAWMSQARNRIALLIGGIALGGGIVGVVLTTRLPTLDSGRWIWLVLSGSFLLIGLAGLSLCLIAVGIDDRGLRITYVPCGWPTRRIPLRRIKSAWAQEIEPLAVGGWGYRIMPGGPAQSAVMVRGGECLVIEYASGRRLAVSVDDAGRGARLLATLREAVG